MLKRRHTASALLVIGLGRFGSAVASSLIRQGREVLAVDTDPILVQHSADEFTYIVQADATDVEVLQQLGVRDFEHAAVAIGQDVEASVLTTLSRCPAPSPPAESSLAGRVVPGSSVEFGHSSSMAAEAPFALSAQRHSPGSS